MSKILIVEDDVYLRRDLKTILEKNKYDVVTASSVGEACSYIENLEDIDLYLLDLWLPDGDGFEICRFIRKKNHHPVIFLSVCDEEEYIVKGLNIGADDYVIKPFRTGELLSRICANLRRSKNELDISVLKCGALTVDVEQGMVQKAGEIIHLSPLEYTILKVLMENDQRIVKRERLLDILWDSVGNCVEDNTLSVNMSRLRNKIGSHYIETIRGFGYRFTEKVKRGAYEKE